MTNEPGPDILRMLRIRPVRWMGGRLNRHWLVMSRWGPCVLRRWHGDPSDVDYELALMERLLRTGLPVPRLLEGPIEADGSVWSLCSHLRGAPQADNGPAEQRERGRLLARFHATSSELPDLGSRKGWRRCEEILADPELDATLLAYERTAPEEARAVRWHLDSAREHVDLDSLAMQPSHLVHGDFAAWNLLFEDGALSGILDFELARSDHLEADFALAWRGKYDEVVYGYDEVRKLDAAALDRITPIWWSGLIEQACRQFQKGVPDDGWIMRKLLLRTPLMGRLGTPCGLGVPNASASR
ncbi:MAG TPA: phosphotransferase [Chthonomonadaceae bacterium]|nr:phosphotransferase [Chthonomonadaceae bacterium]